MMRLPSYYSQFITIFKSDEGYVRRQVSVDITESDYGFPEAISIEKAMLEKLKEERLYK